MVALALTGAEDGVGLRGDDTIRLVTAHRAGDPTAFGEIVRTHYPALLAYARRRLVSYEDAEDAVQETFLRAFRGLEGFGLEGDWHLGAWLNRVLRNVCADLPARRRPTVPLTDWLLEDRPAGPDDVGDHASDPVALAAVRRAIQDLPITQRRAFLLRIVDDLPYPMVAARLGITEDNARARVHRARAALRDALGSSSAL